VIHGGLKQSVNAVSMLVLGIFFISGIDFFLLVEVLFVLFLCQLSGALLVDQVFIQRSSSQTNQINVFNCDFFLILEELFNEFFLFLKLRNRL
jgi:membrane protease YdiL (CAAX protease family)